MAKKIMILEPPREGQTIYLFGTQFVNGQAVLEGTEEEVERLSALLRMQYRMKEADNGQRDIHSDEAVVSGHGVAPGAVSSPVLSNGGGAETSEPATDFAGNDQATSEHGADTPVGHGQSAVLTLAAQKLKKALDQLDPDNDDHWTKDGQPALKAVEQFYGSAAVSRADIRAVAPNLKRLHD